MNKLSIAKRASIVRLLVEGNSLRSCSRIEDVSINTITKILVAVGTTCMNFHNQVVVDIPAKRVEADEIWSYVYSKQANKDFTKNTDKDNIGDAWTWIGMDSDTKLVISWLVGNRETECANAFMLDLADRLRNRVQLTTDGYGAYVTAVQQAFDWAVDYGQIIKEYGVPQGETDQERKYSQPTCKSVKKRIVCGKPDLDTMNTSYIERQNLTMRMQCRRFTRLTNAFSKKIDNHCLAIALHFFHYNFCRIHKTLRVTPAMEAKLIPKPMTIEDIVRITYANELAEEERRLARKNRYVTDAFRGTGIK